MNLVEVMAKAQNLGVRKVKRDDPDWSDCYLYVDGEGDLTLEGSVNIGYLSKEDLLADDWVLA